MGSRSAPRPISPEPLRTSIGRSRYAQRKPIFSTIAGLALRQKGDLDAALADLNRAIELNPKEALFYNSRGLIKRSRGDLRGALADSTQALTRDPNLAVAYGDRAEVEMELKDFMKARGDLNRALQLEPGNEEFREASRKLNALETGRWKPPTSQPTPLHIRILDR